MLVAYSVSSLFVKQILTAPQLGTPFTSVRTVVEVKEPTIRAIAQAAKYDVTDSVHSNRAIVVSEDVSAA